MPQFANDKVENSPNAIALADPYHSYTWVETNEILNRCANNILESDLGEKRRVAVFAENAGETAFAHLGALLGGASSVPVNFHLTAEEAAYILEDSEAQILFVGPHTLERGLEAARQAGIQQVVGWKCDANSGLVDWAEWLKEEAHRILPTKSSLFLISYIPLEQQEGQKEPNFLRRCSQVGIQ